MQFDRQCSDANKRLQCLKIDRHSLRSIIRIQDGNAAAAGDHRNGIHTVGLAVMQAAQKFCIFLMSAKRTISRGKRSHRGTQYGIRCNRQLYFTDSAFRLGRLAAKYFPADKLPILDDKKCTARCEVLRLADERFQNRRL